ncbi:MAG TPA: hypothetical protein PLW94_00270 [Candidatus Absconditabacterales bacterium]|nr:hypothetical protein [Candidatus Absconditabacterales bacterium]
MKLVKKLIAQMFTKKSIKIWSVFLIFVFLFISQTYASNETLDTTVEYMKIIMDLLSRVWIILANLAGALMTNNILYGSFLHLDASLWALWNIMKNFANFALGFFVLFAIVRNIVSGPFGKDAGERKPIKVIQKTLVAGVLIQASWFLMGAVVDVSTIMTSAIGAFPSQFIAGNSEFQGATLNATKLISKNNKIVINPKEKDIVRFETNAGALQTEEDTKSMLDTILPSHNSVSGPLMFLGISVFGFNDYEAFGTAGDPNSAITDWGDLFLSIGLSGAILVFFTVMMFFIFLFNLFRLIILWIIIPLLPIIILLKVFKLADKLGGSGKGLDLGKLMDIKTILKLIFKPVLLVGALSLILVVLVLIKNIIAGNKTHSITFEDQGNIQIISQKEGSSELYTSTMKSDGMFDFSMTGVKDTFADIIVYLFGLFLIFLLVKFSLKLDTGISFIDNALNKTFESLENTLKTLPIVPVGGGAVGISAIQEAFSSGNVSGMMTRAVGIDIAKQTDAINRILGLEGSFDSLHDGMSRDDFISRAAEIANQLGYNRNTLVNNQQFMSKFDSWNKYNTKYNRQAIGIDDILEKMKGVDESSSEPTQSPTPSPTQSPTPTQPAPTK